MKKSVLAVSFGLAVAMVGTSVGLTSCGNGDLGTEIALVTDVGNIDDQGFNQACWEGVQEFSKKKGLGYNYYRPMKDSTTERVNSMEQAISDGAKVLVLPGYLFNSAAKIIQDKHPEVIILGNDVSPSDDDNGYTPYDFNKNTTSVVYQEEQSGFFAGYGAVLEGYTKLGFVGGQSVPAVVRYGQGYLYGANLAAQELGLAAGAIDVKYYYAGTFAPDPNITTKVSGWYTSGTEAVFSCGGGIVSSIVEACTQTNDPKKKVIGVDVDQSYLADCVITSAMKNLKHTTVSYLESLYDNDMKWTSVDGEDVAGKLLNKGAKTDSVSLPTEKYTYKPENGQEKEIDPWRFTTFTKEQYKAVFDKVVAGTVTVPAIADANGHQTAATLTHLTINYSA